MLQETPHITKRAAKYIFNDELGAVLIGCLAIAPPENINTRKRILQEEKAAITSDSHSSPSETDFEHDSVVRISYNLRLYFPNEGLKMCRLFLSKIGREWSLTTSM